MCGQYTYTPEVINSLNTCSPDIPECSSDPCQHGGTCHDLLDHFTCSCDLGYAGTVCETGK